MVNNNVDMKELIKSEFETDPLFIDYLVNKDLDNDLLFPEFLNDLQPGVEYSTKQVEGFLNKSDAMIRYYMNQLKNYIVIVKTSRNYRLKYNQIYKLYLVCLHVDEGEKTINDLKVILGEEQQKVITGSKNKSINTKHAGLSEENIEALIIGLYQDSVNNSYRFQNFFLDYIDRTKIEKEYQNAKEQLYDVNQQVKLLEEKIYHLELTLQDRKNYELEKIKNESFREALNNKFKNSSLFSFLTPSKYVVDEVPIKDSFSEQVYKLEQDIDFLKKEYEKLIEQRKLYEEQYKKIEHSFFEKNQKLLETAEKNTLQLEKQVKNIVQTIPSLGSTMKITKNELLTEHTIDIEDEDF